MLSSSRLIADVTTLASKPRNTALSPREMDVLELICEGLSSKEIGSRLGISSKTVEFHRSNIAKKCGAGGAALMTRWAIRQGIIEA